MDDLLPEIRKRVSYDPVTGLFVHIGRRQGATVGKIVGCVLATGYVSISFKFGGKEQIFLAHRLAWWMVTGKRLMTNEAIDHVNGIRSDNRWANLRQATPAQNHMNTGRRLDNTSGTVGVTWCKQSQKWKARIYVDGKQVQLGLFVNIDDAVAASKAGEHRFWDHNFIGTNRDGFPRTMQ